jgi:RHS repeat-associated protein
VFAYDNAGNPTTWKGAGQTFNPDNQNNAQAYDTDGNPTSWQGNALTFDGANHLTAIGNVLTAGYTAEGLRAWKQSAAGSTYYIYDGLTPIAEVNGSGAVQAVNSWGANGLASRRNVSSNSSVFYTFDAQGNTAQRLDGGGNVLGSYGFDAFGVRASTDNSTDPYSGFGAQWGYYRDSETGLSLLGERYYDASQGRFLNRDPIGYDGGLNLYAYTENNPLIGWDPWGTNTWLQDVQQAMQEGMDPVEKGVVNGMTVVGMASGFMGGAAGGGAGGTLLAPGVGTLGGGAAGAMAGAAEGSAIGRAIGVGIVGLGRIIQGTINHFSNGGDGSGGSGNSQPSQPPKSHPNSGKTVRQILKGKKGDIRRAPLDKGCPGWDDILDEPWENIVKGAKANQPGYKTFHKLLTDSRFDRPS